MLKVNGVEINASGKSLGIYLMENGYKKERVAVELNGHIVPRKNFDSTILCAGDKVEIVAFVGGG